MFDEADLMEVLVNVLGLQVGNDGPMKEVYTISIQPPTPEGGQTPAPVELPYIIWLDQEQGHHRFRWSRRYRGKPEMRLGMSTHGGAHDLETAALACIDNHRELQTLLSDGAQR